MSSKSKTPKAARICAPKPKPIDLGALQDGFTQSSRTLAQARKALLRAVEDEERAKQSYEEAREALKAASRTVTSG